MSNDLGWEMYLSLGRAEEHWKEIKSNPISLQPASFSFLRWIQNALTHYVPANSSCGESFSAT